MSTSARETTKVTATDVVVAEECLTVALSDGRSVVVPLTWFPRLLEGSRSERANWRLVGRGLGIHWPDLDEDVSVAGLLEGRPSSESQSSLARWMEARRGARRPRSPRHPR